WLLTIPRNYYLPIGKEALELVVKYHAGNPKVGKIVGWIGYYRPWGCESEKVATALIEAGGKRKKGRAAAGQAVRGVAWGGGAEEVGGAGIQEGEGRGGTGGQGREGVRAGGQGLRRLPPPAARRQADAGRGGETGAVRVAAPADRQGGPRDRWRGSRRQEV